MEQKTAVSLFSTTTAASQTTHRRPPRMETSRTFTSGKRPGVSTVEDGHREEDTENGIFKLQFRRAYKNLRGFVLDLLKRENARNGLGRRKKQTEEVDESDARRHGGKFKVSHYEDRSMDQRGVRSGKNESPKTIKDELCEANARTVLDTLSTILSSYTYDEDWDPLVNTMSAPLDDMAACIRPGLYISGFLAEQNKADLKTKGITHILQVGENLTRSFEGEFEYKSLALMDTSSTNVLPVFRESLLFLNGCISKGGTALVHCYAGISRSATICIAYLMWNENLSLGAAYSLVERARSVAQPNDGFKSQLQIFESLGSNLGNLDKYLSSPANARRVRCRELSSDDWDAIL